MKNRLRWAAIVVAAILLASAALRAIHSRKEKSAALQAQQVAQQTRSVIELAASDVLRVKSISLQQGLNISGPLKAVNSAFIKARVAGELQDLRVREGDYVKAGQVIARVDSTEFQARVRQAQQPTVGPV